MSGLRCVLLTLFLVSFAHNECSAFSLFGKAEPPLAQIRLKVVDQDGLPVSDARSGE